MGLGKKSHLLVAALLLSGAASAQDLSTDPVNHRFWDAANKALFASHAALEAVDFGITHHNLSHGGREMDSLAKPFCDRGTPGQLVFFAGRAVAVVGISYLLHKTGRHKLERAFPIYASGDSAYGVVYSFVHR
jgi:hypothetical protein